MSDTASLEQAVSGLVAPAHSVGERERESRELDIGVIFPPLSTHVLRTR